MESDHAPNSTPLPPTHTHLTASPPESLNLVSAGLSMSVSFLSCPHQPGGPPSGLAESLSYVFPLGPHCSALVQARPSSCPDLCSHSLINLPAAIP